MSKKQRYWLGFFLAILLSVGLFFFQDKIIHLKTFGLIGLFLISFVGGVLFFPSPVLIAAVVASGSAYPPVVVAIVASLGSTTGDVLGYGVGYMGREAFLDNKKWHHQITEEIFHKFGALFIFLLALIPNPIFDAIGVVAGLFLYPWRKFFLYVFLGRLIRNILLAYLGSAL